MLIIEIDDNDQNLHQNPARSYLFSTGRSLWEKPSSSLRAMSVLCANALVTGILVLSIQGNVLTCPFPLQDPQLRLSKLSQCIRACEPGRRVASTGGSQVAVASPCWLLSNLEGSQVSRVPLHAYSLAL